MKRHQWWLKSGIVYGLSGLVVLILAWLSGNLNATRISWVFGGFSSVFLIIGTVMYCRSKSAPKAKIQMSSLEQ